MAATEHIRVVPRREQVPRQMADWELGARIEHRERELAEAKPGGLAWDILVAELSDLDAERSRRERLQYRRAEAPFDALALVGTVKERADLRAVFGSRVNAAVLSGRPKAGALHILCPFHGDTDPSLAIWESHWWCFGCCQGGDAIDAIEALDGLEFVPALLKLANEFGIGVPKTSAERGAATW